jgi:hypothetical protein
VSKPAYCPAHQHNKWCEHNGGVMGSTGYEAPPPPDAAQALEDKLRALVLDHGGSGVYDMRDLAHLTHAAAALGAAHGRAEAFEEAAKLCDRTVESTTDGRRVVARFLADEIRARAASTGKP